MTEVEIPVARDWMSSEFMVLKPEMELLEAIRQMADEGAAGALVVDENEKLVGILTEKDCLRVLTFSTYHEARGGKVGEYMSPLPECAEPNTDLLRLSKLFLDTNFPLLPVLDGERVVGQISRQQVLQAIRNTARKLEAEYEKKAEIEEEADGVTRRPRSIQEMQDLYSKSSREQLIRRIKRRG
jgi:CBS domain-containing protein